MTVNAFNFDMQGTDIFKEHLEKSINKVKEAALEANVSPAGFVIDESLCDCGDIETSDVVNVIDCFAGLYGDYGDDNYQYASKAMCDALCEIFDKH